MKILNKLTLQNLKLNKTRTAVTIIGIMLSTALIMVVAGMMSSAHQTMIAEKMSYTGNFEIMLYDTNKEYIDKISSNRDIEDVYVQSEMGCAIAPNSKNKNRPYINITGLSKNSFEDGFDISLKEGRLPENENEIILTPEAVLNYNPDIKVGDKITLDLGTRVTSNGKTLSDFDEYAAFIYNEYDEENNLTHSVTEQLENTQKKTFTITGILNACDNGYLVAESWEASSTAITLVNDYSNAKRINTYINIKPEAEKDYIRVTEQVTGLSNKAAQMLWDTDPIASNQFTDADYQEFSEQMDSNKNFEYVSANHLLMDYKGYGASDSTLEALYLIVGIIVLVIVFASVFVIRNSFAISTTEKTKLYGMLISAGATPKQVKKNVLFEGVILGVIGISLGLILGVGVIALLIYVVNVLLVDFLSGFSVVYSLPWGVPVFTIAMSALVIFFSTYSSAVRASKIAPVVAIRENNDVKLSKKEKNYKAPSFIKKLFGQGGVIAYKNLKRSKKKYRTTVISIIVSVAVFITVSTFVDYGMLLTTEMFGINQYNFAIYDCSDEQADVITNFDGISEFVSIKNNYNTEVKGFNDYSEEYKKYDEFYMLDEVTETFYMNTFVFDNDYFKNLVTDHGLDYEQVKDKIIVYNGYKYIDENSKNQLGKCYDISKDAKLEISFRGNYYEDQSATVVVDDAVYGGEIINLEKKYKDVFSMSNSTIIVSEDWYSKNVNNELSSFKNNIYMTCSDPVAVQNAIGELDYYDVDFINYQEIIDTNNSLMLVISIFAYGFITVISLIGVTNIFNTITTNMKLRRKEFASLRSIGMTDKEFNRMIRLETLFYGAKSLALGIPLGILFSFFVYRDYYEYYTVSLMYECGYLFPWVAVLISIICVFVLLWFIMKYSLNKIKKQNIIETIRNDNI